MTAQRSGLLPSQRTRVRAPAGTRTTQGLPAPTTREKTPDRQALNAGCRSEAKVTVKSGPEPASGSIAAQIAECHRRECVDPLRHRDDRRDHARGILLVELDLEQ